ncbi:MAG: short-chain dehydrogenase [Bacteroidetes bacterium]|nr:MAG: short-chain dehydrogenase [Bacteroidota bacterium]
MKQKQVYISGANGGIGSELCKAYYESNHFVIASDLQGECSHSYFSNYHSVDLDKFVSDETYRKVKFSEISSESVSILINNAATQIVNDFEDFTIEEWTKTMNVNVSAGFVLIKSLYSQLCANEGQVVNIASIHSQLTKPNFFAYATSKSALVGMTKSLAVEFKGKITVNAISPAAVGTKMLKAGFDNKPELLTELAELHPSQIIGKPEHIAEFVLQLTTHNNRYLNGSVISIDGGISSALLDLEP